jgi:ferric iron reductase protein FhuF
MAWRSGPYAGLIETWLADDDSRLAVSLPELMQPQVMDQLLLRIYGAQLLADELPVLVSQWSRFYFMQWLPAMLVTQLGYGWFLPLELRAVGLVLDAQGQPTAMKMLEAGEPGEQGASLEPWIAVNMRPLVEFLAGYGGVSAQVLWGNAGDIFERTVRRLEALGMKGLEPALAMLQTRKLADGRNNPLYAPVKYVGDGRRVLRSCCLAYRVVGPCDDCPVGAVSV